MRLFAKYFGHFFFTGGIRVIAATRTTSVGCRQRQAALSRSLASLIDALIRSDTSDSSLDAGQFHDHVQRLAVLPIEMNGWLISVEEEDEARSCF